MDFNILEEKDKDHSLKRALAFKNISIDNLDIKKLFPEFDFKKTYGLFSYDVNIKNYLIAYEQVIINIVPLKDKASFRVNYGLDFREFIILVEKGKILPIICYPFDDFPKFYEELFNIKSFPRSSRIRDFLAVKKEINENIFTDKVEKIVYDNNFNKNINEYYKDFSGDRLKLFVNSFSSDLYDFYLLGMDEIIEIIFEIAKTNPQYSHEIAFDYSNLLIKPLFENIGGINTFSDKTFHKAKSLYLKTEKINFATKNIRSNNNLLRSVENFLGINPLELVKFSNSAITLNIPSCVENKVELSTIMDSSSIVKEFREKLSIIKNNDLKESNINELSLISKEVSVLLKKDVKQISTVDGIIKNTFFIGAILPVAYYGSKIFNSTLATILSTTLYPSLIGKNDKSIDNFSEKISGSIYEKFLNKNLATTYWKSNK